MSGTTTTTSSAISQATSVSTLRVNLESAARNGAQDVPQVVTALLPLVPGLAPKALIASKSPLGTVIGTVLGYALTHYGMMCADAAATNCWTQGTIDTVSGLGALVGTAIGAYVMRYVTKAPIGGIISAPPAPPAA